MKLLVLVACYFMIFVIFLVTQAVLFTYYLDSDYDAIFDFYRCELSGHANDDPCDETAISQTVWYAVLSLIVDVVSPVMLMIFVVNVQELKEMYRGCKIAIITISS